MNLTEIDGRTAQRPRLPKNGAGDPMEEHGLGRRPRIFIRHQCEWAFKNANNYQRHMETHDLVTLGWLCGLGGCKAAYRHSSAPDYVHHIKARHKLEEMTTKDLPEVELLVIFPTMKGRGEPRAGG